MISSKESDMQQVTARERLLLRVGAVAAILLALWAFGLLRFAPGAVVY